MPQEYGKPAITPLGFDFDNARVLDAQAHISLSRTDVLGIVQSALDEIGPASEDIVALKREVLNAVAEGRLADALRTAILGAGRVSPSCRN